MRMENEVLTPPCRRFALARPPHVAACFPGFRLAPAREGKLLRV